MNPGMNSTPRPWSVPWLVTLTVLVVFTLGGPLPATTTVCAQGFPGPAGGVESAVSRQWIWSRAHALPAETTSEQSGYFSIVEGLNGRIYIGTAKYGDNAFLVELDPRTDAMRIVLDAEKEIGVDRRGFAAQAKFHTRNNVGTSGKIYLGTKQGYTQPGEKTTDYLGGHPMVFDPATGKTRVYDIPVKHQGVISVSPDESRGVAGQGGDLVGAD